ncbi:MAG: hypothetical protein JOZ33_15760, partial [Acidobacteriaceae bacterium]|nr:hypothetical protein [Acidobacteriaceae bacterium]
MLRNYLMPGFALVLLAVFAAPRSTPTPAIEPGPAEQRSATPAQVPAKRETSSANVPQIGAGKPLFSPDDVCAVATNEMQEKLHEFGLDYAAQSGTPGPAAEAMIALVPDPVHTHLSLVFDRNIDAIQQALQDRTSELASGWIYTNQWLPWDPVPYQTSQDPVARTNIHVFDANRECAPGFLLFRRNRFQSNVVQDKFLVVFLVGESPTSGILRQDQFINAMRGWRAIEHRDSEVSAPILRILGPTFSASLGTLDTLLQSQNCKAASADPAGCFDRAQVISGSVATSRNLILRSGNFAGLKAANFLSMNESSAAIQEMLVNYFGKEQHLSPEEIAFVSEDETPFGNLLSSMLHPRNPGIAVSSGAPEARPLLFHYPREISQLRNAYEKNSIFSRQSGQQSSTAQTQQDLTLSLEDRHEQEDSVPSFSSTQSPVSEESVLSEMTRAMDRQRIRIAVINGTDVLDVIFVARYLSHSLPNLCVVLLNTDLLFDRSPDVSYFRGMLLANTYPLIPDNIQWTGRFLHWPGNRADHPSPFGAFLPDRTFPSFETTGVYNAVRLLELAPFEGTPAGDNTLQLRSRKPLWLAEYSDPFRGGPHPPLWLSAVGRGGFWPVALLDRDLEGGKPGTQQSDPCGNSASKSADETLRTHTSLVDICAGNASRPAGEGSIPPRMFDAWWWSPLKVGWSFSRPEATQLLPSRLSAICLLALFILFGLILCSFANVDRWPQYLFNLRGTNAARRAWVVLWIILSYSWIARLLILDLPSGRFFRDPLNCGLLFLELVLLLFAAWVIRTGMKEKRRVKWEKRRVRAAWMIVILTLLAQVLFHWVQPRDFAANLFYLYRSQHLFSGVCPILPFIFLFIGVICLVSRHIHSLLVFSPLHKPRMPCHENENSPHLLQFVTRENVHDMLLACYSPWRMLVSKLVLPRRALFSAAKGLLSRESMPGRKNRRRKPQGHHAAVNFPQLPAALLFLTLLMLLFSAYLLF